MSDRMTKKDVLQRITQLEVAVQRLMHAVSNSMQATDIAARMDVPCGKCGAIVSTTDTIKCQDDDCPCGFN